MIPTCQLTFSNAIKKINVPYKKQRSLVIRVMVFNFQQYFRYIVEVNISGGNQGVPGENLNNCFCNYEPINNITGIQLNDKFKNTEVEW